MKRIFYLLIGIQVFSVACHDNFVEPADYMIVDTKSAPVITKTFHISRWINAIPDNEGQQIA